MGFKEWIVRYKDRNSRRGDLAYDIYHDSKFPRGSDKAVLLNYLKWVRRAHPDCLKAFRSAWRSYSHFLKKSFDGELVRENDRLHAEILALKEQLKNSQKKEPSGGEG
ncbi:YozE family protein [Jeotgalibacillus proteolyticus]|uniref:YozE SAM-like domain-containing protein n=1 Tax=Jeotgalibacillus proteolyticus TaxID=2082395 RepID=A0A2S5GB11_9BACL|nr:YozE family protein [Jeotgalibacillus proteolyticus]PPA70180.1 hypothetical protein C4B60_11375 [Jeotgalibacillus proteolyticus]